jgi:thiol-disulfide isomerase/thioredoxin
MKTHTFLVASLLTFPIFAATTAPATSSTDAQAQLDRIHATTRPAFDSKRQTDQQYVQDFIALMKKWTAHKAAMEETFLKAYPDHPEAEKIREDRWRMMIGTDRRKAEAEVNAYLKEHKDDALALYMLAAIKTLSGEPGQASPAIERFIAAHPKDPRGAELLFFIAERPGLPADPKLIDRIIKDYPDTDAARLAAGGKRQREGVGKPFELEFDDVTTGKHIAMKDLKGKVVVIDFWATWCGPCVASMPEMKRVYADYKDKGVEFIGVSLDQPEKDGGLTALKDFIKENQIPWPQYYQGDGWGAKFSSSWGIRMVPSLFVVDADGKLFTTNASGAVEPILKQLLAVHTSKEN